MEGKLDFTPAQVRAIGGIFTEWMARYYEALPGRPVSPAAAAGTIRELLDEPLPQSGTGPERLLEIFDQVIVANSRHNGHPRMFGYVASPGTAAAAFADLLASTLNANVTAWRSAPAAATVEQVAVNWVKEMLGYPRRGAGLFVSGGSMANFAGLAAARSARLPDVVQTGLAARKPLRIYVSNEGHFSVSKAAALLGIGKENVQTVKTGADFRIDLQDLEKLIEEDRAAGRLPCCVVANAGTVASGAFDPIDELAAIAHRYGMWLHVDGAYGGFAVLAPSARPLFRGIELADSVALDPHKWLYLSMGCGCVLYRDAESAERAFAHEAEYTRPVGLEAEEAFVFWDFGPELSRRFRALAVWFQIKCVGAQALAAAVERNIECARHLEGLIRTSPDFELLAPVPLSIVCFRYRPAGFDGDLNAFNERLLVELQRQGHSYVSNARLKGRFALRACVLNYRTAKSDMEILVDDVRRAARSVLAR